MNKYLDYLSKVNPFVLDYDYTYMIKLLILYVKGQIKDHELISKIKIEDLTTFFIFFNNFINFSEEKIRYFIELPDRNFNTKYPKCILAGRLNSYGILEDFYDTIGPKYIKKKMNFFYDRNFFEIEGNFAKIPNGALLTTSDYIKIISRKLNIYEHMIDTINHTLNPFIKPVDEQKIIKLTEEYMLKEINKEESTKPSEEWIVNAYQIHLTDDIIDSIEYKKNPNYIYIPFEDLLQGNFGTFKELIHEEKPKDFKLIYLPNLKR